MNECAAKYEYELAVLVLVFFLGIHSAVNYGHDCCIWRTLVATTTTCNTLSHTHTQTHTHRA